MRLMQQLGQREFAQLARERAVAPETSCVRRIGRRLLSRTFGGGSGSRTSRSPRQSSLSEPKSGARSSPAFDAQLARALPSGVGVEARLQQAIEERPASRRSDRLRTDRRSASIMGELLGRAARGGDHDDHQAARSPAKAGDRGRARRGGQSRCGAVALMSRNPRVNAVPFNLREAVLRRSCTVTTP